MKTKTIIIVLGMLLPVLSIRAQDIKPFSIGDMVPDLALHNVINYKDSVIRLSDFKDKLVILDFMHSGCTGCVEKLIEYNHYPKSTTQRVNVFALTSPSDRGQQRLSEKLSKGKTIVQFASLSPLTELLFPHKFISHLVWIGKNRRIVAITGEDALIPYNLEQAFANTTLQLPVKDDYKLIDYSKRSITGISLDNIHTVVSGYLPNAYSYGGEEQNVGKRKGCRRYYINRSIWDLYQQCKAVKDIPTNLVFSESLPLDKLFFVPNDTTYYTKWQTSNAYCYESLSPANTSILERDKLMEKTLDDYFHLKCVVDTSSILYAHLDIAENSQSSAPYQKLEMPIPKELDIRVSDGESFLSLLEITNFFNRQVNSNIPFSCSKQLMERKIHITAKDLVDFNAFHWALWHQGISLTLRYETHPSVHFQHL